MAVNQFISPGADASHVQIEAPGDGSPIQVSNANLLFKGDYSRSGHDLEISGSDGQTITIEGYFASDSPSALVGPNGGMLNGTVVESLAGPLFPGQYAQSGGAAQSGNPIGEVQHLVGTATATRTDGTVVELSVGTEVYLGDVVETGASTKFGLSLVDGSIFSMTSDARMVLNEFVFNADQVQDSSMLVNIVQGAFVFVAGSIAPTGNMKVETPVAVLAIRGTTVGAEVNSDLGSTELSLFQDIDSNHVGEYLVLDKSTGEIIGKVAEVGSKLVFTGIGETPIVVEKTDLDLASDLDALELIRAVYAKVSGQQGEFDNEGGSGSFLNVQIVALGGSFKIEELSGNSLAAASALKIVVDNPDQDDPPVAFFDGFFTDEDDLFAGNVINNNSIQPDEDPEGFDVRVVGFGQDLIWEQGVDFDFVGGIISPTGSTTFVLNSGAVVEINAAGDFTYNPNPAFNYLADGESAVDSFSYLIADPGNSTDSDTVEVTVYGSNDRPVVVSTQPDHEDVITETAAVQDSSFEHVVDGVVAFEDLDSTDGHNNATTTTPVFEGAVWTRNGVPAETFEDIFGSVELELTESPSPVQDPGNSPNEGTVSWEFTIADQDIDFLGAGETLVLTYTVNIKDDSGTSNDATSQLITVTITGTNDVPLIDVEASTRDISGAVDEIADLSTSPAELATNLVEKGVITFTDVDLSDQHTVSIVSTTGNVITGTTLANGYVLTPTQITALFNAFSVDDGSLRTSFDSVFGSTTAGDGTVDWTYSISDQDVDFLGADDVVDMAFDVIINDGNGGTVTETVTIRVTGTNDAPVITSAAQSGTVTETADVLPSGPDADPANATGTISFSDVDLSDDPSAAHDGGTVSASTLANGYTLTGPQEAALKLAFSLDDADLTDFSQVDGTGSTGWTYDVANADIDFLGEGDSVELTYVVTISDGEGGSTTQNVVITVNGTNDAPVITSSAQSGTVTETADVLPSGPDADPANATGTISFSDVDLSDDPSAAHDGGTVSASTLANGYTLTGPQEAALKLAFSLDDTDLADFSQVDGTGSTGWTYDVANADIDFLGEGDSVELTYVVTISDGEGGSTTQNVVITVNGTNDAAVVAAQPVAPEGSVTEDAAVTTLESTGSIGFTDVDLSDTHIVSAEFKSSDHPDGTSVQLGGISTIVVSPDTTTTGLNGEIDWTYQVANADVQFLGEGEVITETYTITLDDEQTGGQVTREIEVTITGVNDVPVISAAEVNGTGLVEAGYGVAGVDEVSGNVSGAWGDVDQGQAALLAVTDGSAGTDGQSPLTFDGGTGDEAQITGTYGSLYIKADGTYRYVLDNTDAETQALTNGQSVTDSFNYTIANGVDAGDSATSTITVDITGTNDAPTLAAVTAGSIVEDDQAATTTDSGLVGVLGGDDVDSGTLTYGITGGTPGAGDLVELAGAYGTLQLNTTTGAYEYVKDDAAIEGLNSGDTASDSFTITVSDAEAPAVEQIYTVNLTGADEAAVASASINWVSDPEINEISQYAGPVFLGTDAADVFYVDNYGGFYAGSDDPYFLENGEPALIANFDPAQDSLYIDYIEYTGSYYDEGYYNLIYYAVGVDPLNAVLMEEDGFNTTVNVSNGDGTTDLVLLEGVVLDPVSPLPDQNIFEYDDNGNEVSNAISLYDGGGGVYLGVDDQADKFYIYSGYGELPPEPAIILNFEPDQDVLYLDYLLGYYFSGDQSDVSLVDDGTDTTVQVNTGEDYVDLAILQNVTGMEIDIVGPPTPPPS